MVKTIIVSMVLLVASGYLISLCFEGMNQASDFTYIGGIFGLVLWFVFLPRTYKGLVWLLNWTGGKADDRKIDNDSGISSGGVSSDGELHNENRPRDGRHRGGPVW